MKSKAAAFIGGGRVGGGWSREGVWGGSHGRPEWGAGCEEGGDGLVRGIRT